MVQKTLVLISLVAVFLAFSPPVRSGQKTQQARIMWQGCNPEEPNCIYPGPQCNSMPNDDYRYELTQPRLEQAITPVLEAQFQRHYSAYPSYSLPLTFLWDSFGIKNLMGTPSGMSCCTKEIEFNRWKKSPEVADFTWSGKVVTVKSVPGPLLHGYSITITVPSTIRGYVTVSAGFLDYEFRTGPHVKIVSPLGRTIFDKTLQCFKSSDTSVVARPVGYSGTQNNPILVIRP